MNLLVREAAESDVPKILNLYAQASFDNGKVLDEESALEIFNSFKIYPYYKIFVAHDASSPSDVIGTFAFLYMHNMGHMGSPSAIIEDVVVAQIHQGSGIGKHMMLKAMELAKEMGCYKMVLSSNIKREDAHAFYESSGFERHGLSFRIVL